jgi:hypothetical protein
LKKAGLPTVIQPYQQQAVKNPKTGYNKQQKTQYELIRKLYKSSTTCIIMHLQALKTDFIYNFPLFLPSKI